jgi:hypothetical protein
MSKNLIPEIAEMLGVKLGEEFKIKGYDGLTYKFVDYGLQLSSQNDIGITAIPTNVALVNLLNGNDEIIKLPWKPYYRQKYWTFGLKNGIWVVVPREWEDYPAEYLLFKAGWVYRTRAEAKTALPAVAKEMGVEFIV